MYAAFVLALVLTAAAAENCTCATAEQMNKVIEQNHETITALKKQQSLTSELLSKDDIIHVLKLMADRLLYWTDYAYECVFVVSKHVVDIADEITNMKGMRDDKQELKNTVELFHLMKRRAAFGK